MEINEIWNYLITSAKTSEFAQGGIVVAILTAAYQSVRSLPYFIWGRVSRLIVHKTTIEQSDELYNLVSMLVAEKYPNKLRNTEAFLKEIYSDSVYDMFDQEEEEENNGDEIKYRHYSDFILVWYKRRLLKIKKEREKLENARDFTYAYLGRITISGIFSKKAIKSFLKEANAIKERDKRPFIKKYSPNNYSNWKMERVYTNKSVENIFFPEKISILEKVDEFQSKKDFYLSRGIEWYLGILLHGRPGSGKTSFGKALSKYTGRDLYTINLSVMTDSSFSDLFKNIGKNALLLIDDIDIGLNNRDNKDKSAVKLSTLLSHLCGNNSRSDLIVVMTTNDISKLDTALTRKGRIDIIEEVSFPDRESVQAFLNNFYGVEKDNLRPLKFGSMVDIQYLCLTSKSYDEALDKIHKNFKEIE